MLEDHGDLLPELPELLGGQRRKILPVDHDVALGRPFKEVDAAHQRGFARAGHADNPVDLPLIDGQVDVAQRLHRLRLSPECLGQVFQFDERQDEHSFPSHAVLSLVDVSLSVTWPIILHKAFIGKDG